MFVSHNTTMDLFSTLALAGLLGAGGMVLASPQLKPMDIQDNKMKSDFEQHHRDLAEAGISWGTQRADSHHLINLNEVYKPRSAPRQTSTRNLDEIWRDQADITAYLKQYGPQFHFMRDGSIPLGTPQQSNPNVEIIAENVSFRGDPGYSLTFYPRAYVDNHFGRPTESTFSDENDILEAGQPEGWEVLRVPRTGALNFNNNPYGPGGAIQNLNAARHSRYTRRVGPNQATISAPPQSSFGASRYPR